MSGFLKTAGQIAGIAATIALVVAPPAAPFLAAASAVLNVGAALTAKKPPAQGSSTNITIGANMPSPYIIGECYYGGNRIHLAGYGTNNDVPNAYLAAIDIYGVAGPYEALVGIYADFVQVTFSGGNAVGFYHDHLYIDTQLGATPESTALAPFYSGTPDWGAGYKLSGKPAIFYNARFPKSGKKFGSGFPQTGAVWRGVKCYDPRLDSTYPGGSGAHRWADPADKAAFATAKATWTYSTNPGLHALRYALGSWERDETDTDAEYQKVFGVGLKWDGIVPADFVELANVSDDNDWTCNGVIFEPGDKWGNLKSILQAGAAEPCFRNGRLGLRINTPRVSLDTITPSDIADGECVFPAMQSYRDRLNTIIPKYRSPTHKWEYVASNPVQVLDYVTADGEEKAEEVQFNLVTNPDQAAQLAGLMLVGGREAGPITLPCKPRLRGYGPGDMVTLGELGAGPQFDGKDCIIIQRSIDPSTMVVSLTLVTENDDKYAYALALTGTSPPAITITSSEDLDGIAGGPVVASFSQSSNYGGAGVELADTTNMSDGSPDPCASTLDASTDQWIQATLSIPTTVDSVLLKASLATAGWGAVYLNGYTLQYTTDLAPGPSSTWTDLAVLTGFTDGSTQSFGVGALCSALRVYNNGTGFLSLGEFTVS